MSMNLFFQAFTQQELEAMEQDPSLIDQWVWDEKRSALSTDIGTAWDVLNKVLSGAGIRSNGFIDDVLSNGCEWVSTELVREHAERLSNWTEEQVLEGLRGLGEDEAYHLEVYQEEEDDLLEEFGKLVEFYRKAADQGLAVIHFAA